MDKRFNVVIKRRLLQVKRLIEGFFLVELNIFEKILSSDESESQVRNVFVQRKGEISSHLSKKPVENSPNCQRICCNIVLVLVVLD